MLNIMLPDNHFFSPIIKGIHMKMGNYVCGRYYGHRFSYHK